MASALSNQLGEETSPYLRQHADNPVAWQAWNAESLAYARKLDLPILLSIGYSACHWCHVMEHESFQDPATADFMNEHFVCIKVDREERPDLDKIYQLAHHMLTRRAGGWPLTVALSPDTQAPFFAGTYFPDRPRHGMVSFRQVLERVSDYFSQHREELTAHTLALKQAFDSTESSEPGSIDPHITDLAVAELRENFDVEHGGFGGAPKFPHPTTLALCLYHSPDSTAEEQNHARDMAHHTLLKMARGGLFDQLGGGFYRYSVDTAWKIPHFEKMLYDNAQLLQLYANAWHRSREPVFRTAATSTARWVIDQMQSESGGYYSSMDADSEGEEGKFYVWTEDQFRDCLTPPEFAAVHARYGLSDTPNFEGKWHLNLALPVNSVAQCLEMDEEATVAILGAANKKLLIARSRRQPPGVDDKILTSWNGLMIQAMAYTGRILDEAEFVHSGERALDFIRNYLYLDNRLLVTVREQQARLNGYLDDYVFLIGAILELSQSRWRADEIEFAIELANTLLAQFEDPETGGFYFTSNDHETLLHRPKPAADEATPAGNGIAAWVLMRLGHLLGEPRYLQAAERTLRLFAPTVRKLPSAYGALAIAMAEFVQPAGLIVLRGEERNTKTWTQHLLPEHLARNIIVSISPNEQNLPGILRHMHPAGETTAYVCRGTSCSPPACQIQEFLDYVND